MRSMPFITIATSLALSMHEDREKKYASIADDFEPIPESNHKNGMPLTDEERSELKQLPFKEKKKRVKELRKKYAQ